MYIVDVWLWLGHVHVHAVRGVAVGSKARHGATGVGEHSGALIASNLVLQAKLTLLKGLDKSLRGNL